MGDQKLRLRKGRLFLVVAILILIILALAYAFCDTCNQSNDLQEEVETVKDIAAVVNGEEISMEELNSRFDVLSQYEGAFTKQEVLDNLIDLKLLLQEARGSGVEVDQASIDQAIDTLGDVTEEEREQLKGFYEEQLLLREFLEEMVYSNIEVTQSDLENYYSEVLESLESEDEVRARHILVETEEEMNAVLEKLDSGSDFSELAKEYSIDPGSAVEGGDLGFFKKGVMVTEFEQAAFSLEVGEISEPVKTEFGIHLIKREGPYEFEELKGQLEESLLDYKRQSSLSLYLEQLKANAEIIIG